ncbi:epoxyqueuosine reductase QueH [Geobacter sp. DSM 9736]|uniref:epoxyqueuosine reductase QueH n=1 Tax=Geobacter sp. DSM 9736 TaxID=1277350 RepID=UPI000B50BE31|nr:epoxyqueuosine reductase QueH [Geobacter sp. DSM 9736]SNB46329.1 hypothetical protein SAMN06269301_1778 [Geobacter sp. DSM 9736]
MKLLFHICCAPCSVYPVQELRAEGIEPTGYFFNHNIHPYQEYRKRLDTVRQYAEHAGLEVIYRDSYRLEEFLSAVAGEPAARCSYCYTSRLAAAAAAAVEHGCGAFSTSLLYSRYQQHDLIRAVGEELAAQHGITFLYRDFRRGWNKGITLSKELGLYRQQYCGCIYSERDRYAGASSAAVERVA